MKKCSVCKEQKLVFEFSKDKSRHDGLMSKCKGCDRLHRLNQKRRGLNVSKGWCPAPQAEFLKEKLFYNADDGRVYNRHTGKPAGGGIKDGRRMVTGHYNGFKYKMPHHRMVMLLNDVEMPDGWHVHHIDGDKMNDRLENLVVWPADFHIGWHAQQRRHTPACLELHYNHIEWMLDQASGT